MVGDNKTVSSRSSGVAVNVMDIAVVNIVTANVDNSKKLYCFISMLTTSHVNY